MEQRSQKRVHSAVPIQVRGTDTAGAAFEEFTEAVEVSRRGLSYLTQRELPALASVTVTIPGRGPTRPGEGPSDFFSTATVVRAEKQGELNRISLRFVGATLLTYAAETV